MTGVETPVKHMQLGGEGQPKAWLPLVGALAVLAVLQEQIISEIF